MRYKASKQLQIQTCKHWAIWQDHSFHADPSICPAEPTKSDSPPIPFSGCAPLQPLLTNPASSLANHTPLLAPHLPHRHLNLLPSLLLFSFPKGRSIPPSAPGKISLLLLPIIFCLLNYLKEIYHCSWLLHLQTFFFF